MPAISVLLVLVALAARPGPPIQGRLADARTGAAIVGARITIVGERGSVTTGDAGRFQWPAAPPLPIVIGVVLPDGRVARPIRLTILDPARELTLTIDAAFTESVTVIGTAPTIDASPAASRTLITSRDLEIRHPATLPEALSEVPGVGALSEGQAAVPAIRGLARGRTLILVDGSRAATERRAGANASFFDPATAGTIEVARGPGSVAYGSDAFGGVIAVHTRRANYAKGVRVRFAGTAGAGVPEQRGDLEVSAGYGSGAVLVAGRARQFDDYESPAGAVPNSRWRDRGGRVRWEQATGRAVWFIGWQSDLGRALGRPRSDSDSVLVTSPLEDSHRLSAGYERPTLRGFRNIRFHALAAAVRQQTEQDRLPAAGRPRTVERADVSSREVQLRLTAERLVRGARVHVGADLQGRYGLEALDTTRTHNATGEAVSETTAISIKSARRTGVGVFAETDARVAPRLRVSGGLRVDAVRNTNDGGFFGDRSISNAALAGLAGATLSLTHRLTMTAQVARGFRDPLLSDRFYRGPVGRGFIEGNPGLKPETSLQFDVSALYVAGPLRLSAAGYHYRITDLVERYAATPTVFLFRNRGLADVRGAEIEAQAALRHGFGVSVTAETSRGRDGMDGTPLDDVAPAAASLAIRHAAGARTSWFARVKAVGAHRAAGPSEVPTRRYTWLEAGISRRVTRHLEFLGTVRNALNESYQSSAGPRWVWAPGRHGSVTMIVAF
ncbi:MAG TPA: TonB-dependent receptor [Vicinamibacterales bacterium]|nr:TonB-dependent receptor [Vicinamibacterales bacterium]